MSPRPHPNRRSGQSRSGNTPAKRSGASQTTSGTGRSVKRAASVSKAGKESTSSRHVPEARGARLPRKNQAQGHVKAPHPGMEHSEAEQPESGGMRLQKFLAVAGVDSRRKCEEYIRAGRVTVDSEVVTDPARAVDPETQDIRLDSEKLRRPRHRYFLVNKPKGFLCTNRDPQGRPRAVDLVPVRDQRMFTVGRLDETTEGMLLITNDGDLAQRLAHPRFEVVRKYRCQVAGIPTPEVLRQLREGMYFSEGFFRFRSVRVCGRQGQSAVLELELQEGKNREIRRLMAKVGHKVLALERTAFGPLTLGKLSPGEFRELQPFEIHELRQFAQGGTATERTERRGSAGFGYRTGQTRGRRRRSPADGSVTRSVTNRTRTPGPSVKTSGATGSKAPSKRMGGGPAAINKGRDRRRHKN